MKTFPLAFTAAALLALPLAEASTLEEAEALYRQGDYGACVTAFDELPVTERASPPARMGRGRCLFSLQRYADAAKAFAGLPLTGISTEAAYMQGQSLFAQHRYEEARASFERSASAQVRFAESQYYVGVIHNDRGRERDALNAFRRAVEEGEGPIETSALFQIGEVYVELADKARAAGKARESADHRRRAVIAYERVLDGGGESPLKAQAAARLGEQRPILGGEVPQTKGGTPVPVKPWVVRGGFDLKYDTNVINEPEGRTLKVTYKDSMLAKASLFTKYELLLFNRLALTPEISADGTWHARRSKPEVYSNDNTSLAPALRSRFDHKVGGKPAAALAEFEFLLTTRDYNSTRSQLYYSRSYNYVLGERALLLPFGDTTLKANLKFVQNANRSLGYYAPGVSLGQNALLFKRHLLSATVGFEDQRARDPYYDQRNYKLLLFYGMPSLLWNMSVDTSLSFVAADIVNQEENRGLEKNVSPALTITKPFDRAGRLAVNLNYAYTLNVSRDKNAYQYEKHVIGAGVAATF